MVAATRLGPTLPFLSPYTAALDAPSVGPTALDPQRDTEAERAYMRQLFQALMLGSGVPGLDPGQMQRAPAGQTLGDMASGMPGAEGMSQDELVQTLIAALMNPGQLARILQGGRGAAATPSADSPVRAGAQVPMPGSYSVRPGDTLSGIARRMGVPLQQLIAMNPQIANPNLIYPDQQIRIPNGAVLRDNMGVDVARTQANTGGPGTPPRTTGPTAPGAPLPAGFNAVSAEELKRIMPNATDANIQKYLGPLNQAMAEFGINTKERQAAFLSQVAVESGSLRYNEEIASGSAYEGRRDLGNTQPGDGTRFKGRGLIQLTGRANYENMSRALGVDLVSDPGRAANDPLLSARIAAQFFQSRGLNEIADRGDIELVSRRVNGGTNGLSQRIAYYQAALSALA